MSKFGRIKKLQGMFFKSREEREKNEKLNALLLELIKNSNGMEQSLVIMPLSFIMKSRELKLVSKAFDFAYEKHKNQKRMSGDDYFGHLYETALILANRSADYETITAGLLHDILEDTDATEEELERKFGKTVTMLVKGTTKISKKTSTKLSSRAYLKKIFDASSDDIRILLIKIADKLHNVRTIKYLPEKKRMRIAKQALDFYVPLAHRLGMHLIEREMGNLCFEALEDKKVREFVVSLEPYYKKKEEEVELAKKTIEKILSKNKIKNSFYIRKNYPFSIHGKMKKTHKNLNQIHDFYRLVVVTNKSSDCYKILGLIHSVFKPLPKKLKDFIALPSMMTYQAIHTVVVGPQGRPIKIYIRSAEMENMISKGFMYFLRDKKKLYAINQAWKEIIQKQKEVSEIDFAKFLKTDVLSGEIKIFDSQGDIYEIPGGATVMDFAFKFFEKKAKNLKKVQINGKETKINKKLEYGDIVDLEFSHKKQIESSWVKKARLKETIKKIKQEA